MSRWRRSSRSTSRANVANGLTHGVQSPRTPQEMGTPIQTISQNIVGRMFSAISCDPWMPE